MKVKMFMLAGLAFVLIGLGIGRSVAQAPTWEWAKTFGGHDIDVGSFVQQTSDGGYILVGWTTSFGAGGADVWLIKTDSEGNKLWDKAFDVREYDVGYSVQQTSDGGYILLGSTMSFGAWDADAWLIKTDSEGNKLWDKTFGGRDLDEGRSVEQTRDGGYILLGYTYSFGAGKADAWMIKTDSEGNKLWDKTFGGREWDAGFFVEQTRDGGFILLGETWSFGAGWWDVWLIKTDSEGNKLWDKTFGGHNLDSGRFVQQTSDGGYILVGGTTSFGTGGADVWLIKTDSEGNKLWDKTFGGREWNWGSSVQQTRDGGYILLGDTTSFGAGEEDVWLIKTDGEGNKLWDKTFGGSKSDWSSSVQQTSDGGYILLGSTMSFGAGDADAWLIKYRP